MPWDNNSGGSGGNNGGGPWGQAPGGGRGPKRPAGGGGNNGGTPPNLEELLSKGRDQFKGELPGGKWFFAGIALAALVFWGFQSIYQVAPQEVGVELLFGKPKEELSGPGLHLVFWPVETVEIVAVTENQTNISSVLGGRGRGDDGLMLSGDQNIVDVSFSVLWRISDPAAYLFNVKDPAEMVAKTAESAMREVVGRRPADDIFRDDKEGVNLEVMEITQSILDSYAAGIVISRVAIEQVAPPPEVADAFDEVQRAQQDEDRFQQEARQYANTLLGNARGQAAQITEDAAAYKDRVVKEAEGQAARFISIYEEYAKAPEVTRKRLFLETMEEVLGASNMVIIEGEAGSGVVPYLPLNELRSSTSGQGN
ncbi:MAG TPA: FtsH protease activity modulator HflK [Devosia sp.]|nr:FtsH protease activity modulator HflK [Devosia sp.]